MSEFVSLYVSVPVVVRRSINEAFEHDRRTGQFVVSTRGRPLSKAKEANQGTNGFVNKLLLDALRSYGHLPLTAKMFEAMELERQGKLTREDLEKGGTV